MALEPFLSPVGLPCQAPPWGYVAGADLTTGRIAWMHRNGTVRDLSPLPLPFRMGVPDLGGPIVTAGGLVFIGATRDRRFRAFDSATGKELWSVPFDYNITAIPITYMGRNGKQYVAVVAATNGQGNNEALHVFALP